MAGRRDDPRLVHRSVGVGGGHAVVGGEDQVGGLGRESPQNVVHVVAVVDPVEAEEERVQLGAQFRAAIVVPGERIPVVIQVPGQRRHVVGRVHEFGDPRHDKRQMRLQHLRSRHRKLLPDDRPHPGAPAQFLTGDEVEDQRALGGDQGGGEGRDDARQHQGKRLRDRRAREERGDGVPFVLRRPGRAPAAQPLPPPSQLLQALGNRSWRGEPVSRPPAPMVEEVDHRGLVHRDHELRVLVPQRLIGEEQVRVTPDPEEPRRQPDLPGVSVGPRLIPQHRHAAVDGHSESGVPAASEGRRRLRVRVGERDLIRRQREHPARVVEVPGAPQGERVPARAGARSPAGESEQAEPVLEAVQGNDRTAPGEPAEQVPAAGAERDRGRDDAAGPAFRRGDRRGPFGEQLVGLERGDAACGQSLHALGIGSGTAGESEGGPVLVPADPMPRGVHQNTAEAALPEDVRELQVPVEEAVLGPQPLDLRQRVRTDGGGTPFPQVREGPVDDRGRRVAPLGPDECRAPGIGEQAPEAAGLLRRGVAEQGDLTGAGLGVGAQQRPGELRVVAVHGRERRVGDAVVG